MKFIGKKSGNKYQKGQVTSYSINLSISLLKSAGFILDDGTVLEYQIKIENGKIIIEKNI